MIRFWVFAAFVLFLAFRSPGGVKLLSKTAYPFLQITRGVLLPTEIAIFVFGLAHVGLVFTQAIFQSTPVIVTVLSLLFLGECVGLRRWIAVVGGQFGVLQQNPIRDP